MTNEQHIWTVLYSVIKNPYGVAAVMGNLRAESTMNPMCMTGQKVSQWKNGQEYTDAVNNDKYDRYSFSHDGIAYGVAQWRYWSRKEALFDYCKNGKLSIGNIDAQLGFMLEEMPKYRTAWNSLIDATDIATPCDIFMERYEKPGNVSETAKQKRRGFATTYYETFYSEKKDEPRKIKMVQTTAPNVFVRSGNGKEYGKMGKIFDQGSEYLWIATAENNWHAIKMHDHVVWISGDYSKVIEDEPKEEV